MLSLTRNESMSHSFKQDPDFLGITLQNLFFPLLNITPSQCSFHAQPIQRVFTQLTFKPRDRKGHLIKGEHLPEKLNGGIDIQVHAPRWLELGSGNDQGKVIENEREIGLTEVERPLNLE